MANQTKKGLALVLALLVMCGCLSISVMADGENRTIYTRGDVGCVAYTPSDQEKPEGAIPNHTHWERDDSQDERVYENCQDSAHEHTGECGEGNLRYAWVLAENEWVRGVKVYLKYDHTPPVTINQGDVAANYGPSGNNAPYFTVSIDMTMLEEQAGFSRVGGEKWYFSVENPGAAVYPAFSDDRAGYLALWRYIYGAMESEDQEKFIKTFGQNVFVGYVVKNQADGLHLDGYADVNLPYYQVEVTDTASGAMLPVLGKNCVYEDAYALSDVKTLVESYLTGLYGEVSYTWSDGRTVAFRADGRNYQVTLTPTGTTAVEADGTLRYQKLASAVDYFVAAFSLTQKDVTPPSYTLTTSAVNGTITPGGLLAQGSEYTVSYAPNEGYALKSVSVDGESVDTRQYAQSYTFSNITANHTIAVVYESIQLGFYVNLNGSLPEIPGDAGSSLDQNRHFFTPALHSSPVSEPQAMVGALDTVLDGAIRAYYGDGRLHNGFPSDVAMLSALQELHLANPQLTIWTLDQREVNWNRLDTGHYRLAWYLVQEDSAAGWCIDGVLVDVSSGGPGGGTGGGSSADPDGGGDNGSQPGEVIEEIVEDPIQSEETTPEGNLDETNPVPAQPSGVDRIPVSERGEEFLDDTLAQPPQTGDALTLWLSGAGVSGVALAGVLRAGKKRRED